MPPFRNRLLAALPTAELELLTPHLESVRLEPRMIVYDAECPIEHVYFAETGVISILSIMAHGSAIETATIGNEGMVGIAVFHGVEVVPEQAFVQVPGDGYRMRSGAFRQVIPHCRTLQQLLHRSAVAMFTFAAQSSGCNRSHTMEQRCARWLLTVHDRVEGDEFALTQDFLSQMLGVRRATVSETASELQRANLIQYSRGRIRIVDRPGLERVACECYGIIRSVFARLIYGRDETSILSSMQLSAEGKSLAGDGSPVEPDAAANER